MQGNDKDRDVLAKLIVDRQIGNTQFMVYWGWDTEPQKMLMHCGWWLLEFSSEKVYLGDTLAMACAAVERLAAELD